MITLVGESETPMGKMKARTVVEPMGLDKLVFTMYLTMRGGAETKAAEITYTRK